MDFLTHLVTYDEYWGAFVDGGRKWERRFLFLPTRSRAASGGGSSGGIRRFWVSSGLAGEVNGTSGAVGWERAVTLGPSLQNPDYSDTNNPVWEVLAHGAHT